MILHDGTEFKLQAEVLLANGRTVKAFNVYARGIGVRSIRLWAEDETDVLMRVPFNPEQIVKIKPAPSILYAMAD